jgi:hypothetical protein
VEFKTAAAVIVQNTLTLNINIFYLTNTKEKQKRQGIILCLCPFFIDFLANRKV